jgi:putative two-component system protein, hydrogenase maturation factor HypX/HoxX
MTTGAQPILFLVSAHNGLSQCAWIELTERGYDVVVAVVDCVAAMEDAVAEHRPWLIVCPFLTRMIPESIWSRHRCLIVHPGPAGDRGPSSLDWAIEERERAWGVTVLQANGEFDAGDVLTTGEFTLRDATKSSLYRHEVRHAAVAALVRAVNVIDHRGNSGARGAPVGGRTAVTGRPRPLMAQDVRAIDWGRDGTETILRKLRAAEGHPGVLDEIEGVPFHLFGPHRERVLRGRPGEIVATREQAICRAAVDGAVWITHLKRRDTDADRFFKLPATRALSLAGIEPDAPEVKVAVGERLPADHTYRDIAYWERGAVGYLQFDFYNGAMSTDQCRRLQNAYAYACSRPQTRVIVLMGGSDYFSNGIHLAEIEAADDPAAESWRNLRAINSLVSDVVRTDSHIVIAALAGDAGAGGVPFALAADIVVAGEDVVLNPYYKHMGGLYGSEYWTYLLPRRVGDTVARRLTSAPFEPVGCARAMRLGLVDAAFDASSTMFHSQVRTLAETIAGDPLFERQLAQKRVQRASDERVKPLESYSLDELARSYECFFGADPSYHDARRRFLYKIPARQCSRCANRSIEERGRRAA